MKVIRIKQVGKVPVGRIVSVTRDRAYEEVEVLKISKHYDGVYADGENPIERKLEEKELKKRIEALKKTKKPKPEINEKQEEGKL